MREWRSKLTKIYKPKEKSHESSIISYVAQPNACPWFMVVASMLQQWQPPIPLPPSPYGTVLQKLPHPRTTYQSHTTTVVRRIDDTSSPTNPSVSLPILLLLLTVSSASSCSCSLPLPLSSFSQKLQKKKSVKNRNTRRIKTTRTSTRN